MPYSSLSFVYCHTFGGNDLINIKSVPHDTVFKIASSSNEALLKRPFIVQYKDIYWGA